MLSCRALVLSRVVANGDLKWWSRPTVHSDGLVYQEIVPSMRQMRFGDVWRQTGTCREIKPPAQ